MIIDLDKPIEDVAKCNETKCEQKTHCLRYLLKPTRIHDEEDNPDTLASGQRK